MFCSFIWITTRQKANSLMRLKTEKWRDDAARLTGSLGGLEWSAMRSTDPSKPDRGGLRADQASSRAYGLGFSKPMLGLCLLWSRSTCNRPGEYTAERRG